jgi:hypothetical protein
MKKICFLVASFLFLIPNLLLFAGDWKDTEFGSFKIERFWEETVGDYTCSYTLVTYRNTTKKTFSGGVTIRATVYDSNKNMVDSNTRSLFALEYGTIKPGFEGIVKIPIDCNPGKAHSVSVKIDSAR